MTLVLNLKQNSNCTFFDLFWSVGVVKWVVDFKNNSRAESITDLY